MNVKLLVIGKTNNNNLNDLINLYSKKLNHYVNFEIIVLKDPKKNSNKYTQKEEEARLVLSKLKKNDYVILLDENGIEYGSVNFSKYIQKKMNSGLKNLYFIIGGPYGFSNDIIARSNFKLSLSKMTFSHEMIRLFFTEQLYRAYSILNNEPYHHK
jgi:23S rRNA (pseudouridine1915-N3)-methyltransferase|tara:strand:- start:339 stop:806 length:468 start_codon:yes stop_codon:yes gene_type:complete